MLVKRNLPYYRGVVSDESRERHKESYDDGVKSLDKNQYLTKEQIGCIRDSLAEMSCEIDYMNRRIRKIMDIINNIYLS